MAKNQLKAVISLQDDYTANLKKIITSTKDAESKLSSIVTTTDEFNKNLKEIGTNSSKAGSGVDSLVGKLGALVSVGYAINKAFTSAWDAIQTATKQQIQLNTISAIVGNDEVGGGLYNWISDYAAQSMLGREEIATGVTSFLSTTRDFSQLQQLVGMVERLYAKDPTQGAEGAVFALKEILSGDTLSMRNRFNITGFDGGKIRKMIANGETAEAINYISGVMDKFGASTAVVEKNASSLATQLNILTSNFKTAFGENMKMVMEALLPSIQQLSEDLSAGKFQPFFDLFIVGGMMVANVISFVVEHGKALAIVLGVATAMLGSFKIASVMSTIAQTQLIVATIGATGATLGFNAALLANPLVWFIGLLALGVGAFALFNKEASKLKELNTTPNLALDYKSTDFASMLAGTAIPVNVENDSVSVTGKVDIEQDNLKYLLDIAQREYVAKFTTATLAPNINVSFGDVHETADASQIVDVLQTQLSEMISNEAEGALA